MTEATPAPAPGAAYSAPVAENPGKTLGIVGLVLAFVANIVGLIVSIIALNKSKKAGFKNGPALAGIIISIISIVIVAIIIIATVALAGAGVAALQELCEGMAPGVYELDGGGNITCS
ncbi:MAG TPA: hypothetical protein VFT01_01500 [Homoserinimonas sp.]|nr:hypothetical protein [Homoserinimonas sp.]